jgi:hypothetical protein
MCENRQEDAEIIKDILEKSKRKKRKYETNS